MTPGFSMMGSGIYSETVTYEIVCAERGCNKCDDLNKECKGVWEQDFETDDWGNISDTVKCPQCNHEYTFEREAE
jgi:hypothetical protein